MQAAWQRDEWTSPQNRRFAPKCNCQSRWSGPSLEMTPHITPSDRAKPAGKPIRGSCECQMI